MRSSSPAIRLASGVCAALATLCIGHSGAFAAADLPGHWEGQIEIPGSPLDFDVDLSCDADGCVGDISIPAQGASDLPLRDVSVDGDAVRFTIDGVPGDPTFEGIRDGDQIAGDFQQGPGSYPFAMSAGENAAARAAEALDGIDAVVEEALEAFGIPGVGLSVVVDGQVVLEKGYGQRNVETGEAVTSETLFAIGSTSKAFTAFILGTLVDEGRIEWDEPVRTYLPEFRMHDEVSTARLTVRDLLIHTSGLPRHDLSWYGSDASREELFSRLQHLEPTADLRAQWQYQNIMFMTAGFLAERVTDKSWEELVAQRIFEPLGVTRANFSVEEMQGDDNAASPHSVEDQQATIIPYRNIDSIGPAGSINAAAVTASRWMRMLLGGGEFEGRRLIEESTLRELFTPQSTIRAYPSRADRLPMGYAMGWVLESHRGHFLAHHGGGIDGFISWIAVAPFDRVGVAVYTNGAGFNPVTGIVGRTVIDRVVGLEPDDYLGKAREAQKEAAEAEAKQEEEQEAQRVEGTSPAHESAAYVGTYLHPGYGDLVVEEADESLNVTYNGMSGTLEHWHFETFSVTTAEGDADSELEGTKLLFRTDVDGRISAVEVVIEPALPARVFERAPDERLSDPDYLQRFVGVYELDVQRGTVTLSGSQLKVSLPGQPAYLLEPKEDDTFALAGLTGFSLQFLSGDDGAVTGARFLQPNGVFEAEKVE